jgi:hypothetical protein
MKKHDLVIALFILLLASCGPSESSISTAMAETEIAKPSETPRPTHTSTPTQIPTPTETMEPKRGDSFSSSYSELEDYFQEEGLEKTLSLGCMIDNPPLWVQCDNYYMVFEDGNSQLIQVLHDNDTVMGVMLCYSAVSVETKGLSVDDFVIAQNLPAATMISTDKEPTRFDDFVFFKTKSNKNSYYTWLDVNLAMEIYE